MEIQQFKMFYFIFMMSGLAMVEEQCFFRGETWCSDFDRTMSSLYCSDIKQVHTLQLTEMKDDCIYNHPTK